MPLGLDSAHAAEQVVNRWVTDELLSQEARRLKLQDDPEVRRQLAENERSVLISSLIDRLYEQVETASEEEILAYFQRNVSNLSLREPFLRVWYFTTSDSLQAVGARQFADSASVTTDADSLWMDFLSRRGDEQASQVVVSSNYYPVSRLFRNLPFLQDAVASLQKSESTTVESADSLFHVILLADRVEAGATPRVEWITEVIRNRLLIEKRKQMYIDQVQRLRNRALAEGRLEVRE
jgi:hypothetical protein